MYLDQIPESIKNRNRGLYYEEVEKHDREALEKYAVKLEKITGKSAIQQIMDIKG